MEFTEEMRKEGQRTRKENVAKRPNFKIGEYLIRTDDVCFWFENAKGKTVTGFHAGITVGLLLQLKTYMERQNDLSGDWDTYLTKYKQVSNNILDNFKDTIAELKNKVRK